MSNILDSKLKLICPDKWVARAYSEYLADCAEAYSRLIAGLTAIVADEDIQTVVDQQSDLVSEKLSIIDDEVIQHLYLDGVINQREYNRDSTAYKSMRGELFADEDSQSYAAKQWLLNYNPEAYGTGDFNVLVDTPVDNVISYQVTRAIQPEVQSLLQELDLDSDSNIMLNDGEMNIMEFCMMYISLSVLKIDNTGYYDSSLTKLDGSTVTKKFSATEMVDELKSTLAATVAWAQGFASLEADNLSDAMTKFKAGVSTIISDTTEGFSSVVNTVANVIATSGARISEFFSLASNYIGWSKVDDQSLNDFANTDFYNFTGASPMGAISFKSSLGFFMATGAVLVGIGKAIFDNCRNLIDRVQAELEPVKTALSDNPMDIAVIDASDSSYAIGNLRFTGNGDTWLYSECDDLTTPEEVAIRSTILSSINDIGDEWYGLETYFSEICFRVTNVHQVNGAFHLQYDYMYRPKIIDPHAALDMEVINDSSVGQNKWYYATLFQGTHWENLRDWLAGNSLYLDDSSDETTFLSGLALSHTIAYSGHFMAFRDINDQCFQSYKWRFSDIEISDGELDVSTNNISTLTMHHDTLPTLFNVHFTSNDIEPIAANNKFFAEYACGAHNFGTASDPNYEYRWIRNYSYDSGSNTMVYNKVSCEAVIVPLLAILVIQKYDRRKYPTNYLFVPYCKGTYSFSAGRYKIKTDKENADIANAIANVIFTIITVAVILLIGVSIAKIVKLRKQAKLRAWIAKQDNAMWSEGKKLNFAESIKYNRYTNKLEALSGAASGLAGSTSMTSTILHQVNDVGRKLGSAVDIRDTITSGKIVMRQTSDIEEGVDTASGSVISGVNSNTNSKIQGVSSDLDDIDTKISSSETSVKTYVNHLITGN